MSAYEDYYRYEEKANQITSVIEECEYWLSVLGTSSEKIENAKQTLMQCANEITDIAFIDDASRVACENKISELTRALESISQRFEISIKTLRDQAYEDRMRYGNMMIDIQINSDIGTQIAITANEGLKGNW